MRAVEHVLVIKNLLQVIPTFFPKADFVASNIMQFQLKSWNSRAWEQALERAIFLPKWCQNGQWSACHACTLNVSHSLKFYDMYL